MNSPASQQGNGLPELLCVLERLSVPKRFSSQNVSLDSTENISTYTEVTVRRRL